MHNLKSRKIIDDNYGEIMDKFNGKIIKTYYILKRKLNNVTKNIYS